MEGRGFMFTVFATLCFLSIILEEASGERKHIYDGMECYQAQCCPVGLTNYRISYENCKMEKCCDELCHTKSKRCKRVPEERFIQQKRKYKADFEQYLEQSWPDEKFAFLQWLSQKPKI